VTACLFVPHRKTRFPPVRPEGGERILSPAFSSVRSEIANAKNGNSPETIPSLRVSRKREDHRRGGGRILLLLALLALSTAGAAVRAAPSSPAQTGMNMGMGMMPHMNMMRLMKDKAWVKEVQRALVRAGARIPVDGVCGIKTVNALRAFQKAHGLKVTGMIDPATLHLLGVSLPRGMKKPCCKH
jgi:murein L,D-transpeptidase YcbB/YkuD